MIWVLFVHGPSCGKDSQTENITKICYCIHKGREKVTFHVNTFSREPEDISKNGRVRTSKNSLLYIHNSKSIKYCQNKYLQDSGNETKTCSNSWECLFKKNTWISVKPVSFVAFLTCLIIVTTPNLGGSLANYQAVITVKSSSMAATRGGRRVLEHFESFISRQMLSIWLVW